MREKNLHINSPLLLDLDPHLRMLRDVLMTYTVFDYESGYVQGMNDLLSPLLYVMHQESEAVVFWTFENIMQRKSTNFSRDQSGMRRQLQALESALKLLDPILYKHFVDIEAINLFCVFRWLLILYKREFSLDEVVLLWDILFSCDYTRHFHLFVAVALLNTYRDELMACTAFDQVLKYVNDLSGVMDLPSTLRRADILFGVLQECLANRLGINGKRACEEDATEKEKQDVVCDWMSDEDLKDLVLLYDIIQQ